MVETGGRRKDPITGAHTRCSSQITKGVPLSIHLRCYWLAPAQFHSRSRQQKVPSNAGLPMKHRCPHSFNAGTKISPAATVHFLEKKPSGTVDERMIQIDCNTALDAGIYTFPFADGNKVRARYTFTYKWYPEND